MELRNFRNFSFGIILLITFIIYIVNFHEISLQYSAPNTFKIKKENIEVKNLPEYKIDGKDRFEWYNLQWRDGLKNETPPIIKDELILLQAYEFDFEYSVSITSRIFKAIVFCRYFNETGNELLPAFKSQIFPDYVVNCEKRAGTAKVSLSTEQKNNFSYPIPLNYRMAKEYKYELSFCMAPIYGSEPKWLQIAETIEHYKLQGVQHFYFYVANIDAYSNVILQDYVRTGEVELVYVMDKGDRPQMDWQEIEIRDCTLRTRYDSKWVIFADIDERLLMNDSHGTLLDFLKNVSDETIGGFQFRQQWILKTEFLPEKYEGDEQIDEWLPTLRWHNSSAYGQNGHTAKCIMRPEKTYSMWIHYAKIMFPGYYLHPLDTEGYVRHYRDQQLGKWGKKWLAEIIGMGPMSLTDYPKKFQKSLTEAVKKRTKYVYGNYTENVEPLPIADPTKQTIYSKLHSTIC